MLMKLTPVKKRDYYLVQNFSLPKVKTCFSRIGQHVVKVHVYDGLQVRQLEEDDLVAELLEDGRGFVDGTLTAGSGGKVSIVIVPVTNTVLYRFTSIFTATPDKLHTKIYLVSTSENTCSQCNQHFLGSFFATFFCQKNYKAKLLAEKSFEKHFHTKSCL